MNPYPLANITVALAPFPHNSLERLGFDDAGYKRAQAQLIAGLSGAGASIVFLNIGDRQNNDLLEVLAVQAVSRPQSQFSFVTEMGVDPHIEPRLECCPNLTLVKKSPLEATFSPDAILVLGSNTVGWQTDIFAAFPGIPVLAPGVLSAEMQCYERGIDAEQQRHLHTASAAPIEGVIRVVSQISQMMEPKAGLLPEPLRDKKI